MTTTTLAREQSAVRSSRVDLLRQYVLRHPVQAFSVLTALYIIVCCAVSHQKLLWLDELITLHIARLGSVREIWGALAAGADPNPPMTHLLVHASRLLFGESAFALRLPSICGYWLGMLALFAYLARRVPADWALAGTVLSMTMAGFDFSFESRSYALLYGFTMAAFFCWTVAVESPSSAARRGAIAGIFIALIAALCTNYFAVLAFVPIGIGEAMRWIERSRRNSANRRSRSEAPGWPVWLALLAALTPLLVFRTQIDHSIAQFAPHAWNKVSLRQVADSYTQMVEIVLYPLLAVFLLYAVWRLRERGEGGLQRLDVRPGERPALLSLHERAAVLCLVLYPVAGYCVATVRGGMLSPRFVVPVCLGFAIAGTLAWYRLFGHNGRSGMIALCFLLCWFVARETYVGYTYTQQRQSFERVESSIAAADTFLPGNVPLVVPDPLMVLTLQHYAPAGIASRIIFPVDFAAIWKYRGDDSPEQNLWAGRGRLYPVPIVTVPQLQQSNAHYLILATDGNWLLKDLASHGYQSQRLPVETHADEIKGFTPLMHGLPVFYAGHGALASAMRVRVPELPNTPGHQE